MSEQSQAPATGATPQAQAQAAAAPQQAQTAPAGTDPVTAADAAPQAPEGVPKDAWEALGDPGKAALTAEREARAAADKKAAELQAQLDEVERAKMSDLERAQADAKAAQEAASKATAEALRYRIAAAHGIDTTPGPNGEPSDAETFLTAADEAGMTSQAQRLAARTSAQGAPTFPRPDLTQGSGRDTANGSGPDADFAKFLTDQLG
jgi:hypothetical protein